MINPYARREHVPGPYSDGVGPEEKRQSQTQQSNETQSDKAAGGVALLPGDGALIAQSASQVAVRQVANQAIASGAVSTAAASATPALVVLNALGAAHAAVAAMTAAVSAVSIVVAQAITAATAVVGPFVVLEVAKSYGITNAAEAEAAAQALAGDDALQASVAKAIGDAAARFSSLSQNEQIAQAGAILETIIADLTAAPPVLPALVHVTNNPPVVAAVLGDTILENAGGILSIKLLDKEEGVLAVDIPISHQDFEAASYLDVPWSITDKGGLTVSGVERVTILDVNEAPNAPVVTSSFDGHTLTITASAIDPDGEALPDQTWTYTVQQLAAGVSPFTATFTDVGGLTSSILIEPPKLAAQAAADHPVAPTILGFSLSSLAENQGGVLTVTAYDAIDSVIRRDYTISPQNYETTPQVVVPIEITNSAGLSTGETAHIAIANVNEIFWGNPGSGVEGVRISGNNITMTAFRAQSGNALADINAHSTDGQPLSLSISDGRDFTLRGSTIVTQHSLSEGNYQITLNAHGASGDAASTTLYFHIATII